MRPRGAHPLSSGPGDLLIAGALLLPGGPRGRHPQVVAAGRHRWSPHVLRIRRDVDRGRVRSSDPPLGEEPDAGHGSWSPGSSDRRLGPSHSPRRGSRPPCVLARLVPRAPHDRNADAATPTLDAATRPRGHAATRPRGHAATLDPATPPPPTPDPATRVLPGLASPAPDPRPGLPGRRPPPQSTGASAARSRRSRRSTPRRGPRWPGTIVRGSSAASARRLARACSVSWL